jgi:hypothetical protein
MQYVQCTRVRPFFYPKTIFRKLKGAIKGRDAPGLMFSDKFRLPKYVNSLFSPNRTSFMQQLDQGVIRGLGFIRCAEFPELYLAV